MKKATKFFIKKYFGQSFIDSFRLKIDRYLPYKQYTYSQFGEDLFLREYFYGKREGFYVDVGAFHPKKLSNTFYLYKSMDWSGLNVEANPDCIRLFNQVRKRDVNINLAVSSEKKFIQYHSWGINSENSMAPEQINAVKQQLGAAHKVIQISAEPLSELLDNYLPKDKKIDFLNIDVEGHDLEVLKSNNWERYRPKIVLVEQFGDNFEDVVQTEVYNYLLNLQYQLVAWFKPTLIFEHRE